ncbi:ABC transporter G family member 23-like isoform X2 [Anoplolepis gracilipes]|uniref:ABC transporter G family member 23-like isoform X2 n=1 Tax=Anoplolepis gracilipes TaxID=354296 RepID=UPI003BA0901C
MMQQNALVVKNAVKYYEQEEPILDGLNMTVSKGSIYALLGPSGCGKTTLLSCIVGIKNLNKGNIWILGGHPGKPGSGIPGPRVGYMPQQISLVGEFSVSGALYYFGRINGLEDKEIDARQKFLSELLQLPSTNCLIKNISGGQQRRVSFAAALIHSPELLILDEPTVGLDPILRENIWLYLTRITQEEGITVLMTTHYIEEAKDANMIGLMRRGKLLAESSSQKLLERFQCSSLEEVFVNLCQSQNNEMNENVSEVQEVKDTENDTLHQDEDSYKRIKDRNMKCQARSIYNVSALKRFKALMIKNITQFVRFYATLVFAVFFPLIQIATFFVGVGGDPKDLTIGIINYEAGNCDYGNNIGSVWYDEESLTCRFHNLSCRFLREYGDSIANQKYYNDMSEAINAAHDGDLVGVMHFSHNFSEALQRRIDGFAFIKTEDILPNEIDVFLDMGDMQIGQFMVKKLYERFFEIFEDLMKECKYPSKLGNVPIRFDTVYGTMDDGYDYFFTPSLLMTLPFFLSTTLSTFLIISDRLEGVWDRNLVQGFFISVTCKTHTMANYTSIGSFGPLVMLSGAIWPIEAMPKMVRYVCYCMPPALPSIAMRAVIFKGYTLNEKEVYMGILVSVAYIVIFFITVLFGLRSKS